MFSTFSHRPKQMLRLLCFCILGFVLNSSNLTMQDLHKLYTNGLYQFYSLIVESGNLPESAFTDLDSLRYLATANNLKALLLLAEHYQSHNNDKLALKLYFKILTLEEGDRHKQLARQSILAIYENNNNWTQINHFLTDGDEPKWHYLAQLHNSNTLKVLPSNALQSSISQSTLLVGRDFVNQESLLKPSKCKVNIVPISTSYNGIKQVSQLVTSFNKDVFLSSLPVCFTRPLYIEKAKLKCSSKEEKAISCDLTHLAKFKSWPKDIRHLMILAEKGKANVNLGIMYLAQNSQFSTFKHEFMHFLGFEDEYKLSSLNQQRRCKLNEYSSKHSQLSLLSNQVQPAENLIKVPTCNDSQVTAYKTVESLTLMQYLDKDFPLAYQNKLTENINKYLSDFPVFSMAFANFMNKKYWYGYASKLGFKGALVQLALYQEENGNISQAIKNLQQAAEWPLAKSHLARIYYEQADYKKAREYYLQASELSSDSFAQYFYGKMLLNGIGGTKDKSTAMHYFKLSAAQNNPLALQYLNNEISL